MGTLKIWNASCGVWETIQMAGEGESGIECISVTYEQLVALIGANGLTCSQHYLISDYQTKHYMLDGDGDVILDEGNNPVINTGALEPLIVMAISANQISHEAKSPLYPLDVIHYDWNPENWKYDIAFAAYDEVVLTGWKGVIYFRHDTYNDVYMGHDFRKVLNRRWIMNYPVWDSGTTYAAKDKVQVVGDGAYVSMKADNLNNAVSDTDWWTKIIDYTITSYVCSQLSNAEDPDDYIDVPCFYSQEADPEAQYNLEVKSVHIEPFRDGQNTGYVTYSILDNNVFALALNTGWHQVFGFYADAVCQQNTFQGYVKGVIVGNNFNSNTIGNYFNSNTIENDFSYNTIGNYFNSNTIGNYFSSNTIGNNFNSNTIENNFYSNTIGNNFYSNTIENDFNYNTIENNFNSNTIGNNFSYNTIENNFSYNTIGNYFNLNTIENDFSYNTIGNNFSYNTIENYFNYNTIGNYFNSNTIGNYFNYNTIENDFSSNTIGNYFYYNTIENDFSSNTIGNYFNYNTIGNNLSYNTIGNYFSSNTIGNYFNYNTIGDYFGAYNTGSLYVGGNTIEDNVSYILVPSKTSGTGFQSNLIRSSVHGTIGSPIDFTCCPEVYQDYNCEIYKRPDGTIRLTYKDNNDATVVVSIEQCTTTTTTAEP